MPRPRFAPGSLVRFPLKQRPGAPRDAAAYLATRLAVPGDWVVPLVWEGRVSVDGATLRVGDTIDLARAVELAVQLPDAWPPHLAPTPMDLSVLHEDEHLLALDKPPGVIVHPARGHLDNQSLQNGVRHRHRDRIGRPGVTLGSPHRLDLDTSGVVVFALTTAAYRDLVEQFSNAQPHKEYLLLVDGRPDFDQTTVSAPLGPHPTRRGCGAIVPEHEGGKPSRTDFHVLDAGADWGFLRAVPHTGRAHQIRIHAARLGLPLLADADYNPTPGPAGARSGMTRQALHAAVLRLRHPATGAPLRLEAPLPEDFLKARERLQAPDRE